MKIERSKLNSKQKRAIFKKYFGEILFKAGFIYSDNCFVRVHPGECILLVGLDIELQNCYVVFDAIPLCCEERVCNPTIMHRVDSFHKKSSYSFEEYYLKAFDNGRFELQLELFNLFVKERFIQIQTVAQLLAFENEILFLVIRDAGRWYIKMLECVQLQEYEAARGYIQKLRDHEISCLKSEKENLRFDLQWIESKREKELSESRFEEYAQKCKKTLDLCNKWENMIICKEYVRIHSMIDVRIRIANEFCRIKWGEFYK